MKAALQLFLFALFITSLWNSAQVTENYAIGEDNLATLVICWGCTAYVTALVWKSLRD